MRVLTKSQVESCLKMSDCIDVMREVMTSMGKGETHQPLRTVMTVPGSEQRLLGIMPGYIPNINIGLGAKIITVFSENFSRGLPSHQGYVILFDEKTGAASALVDADAITAIRTAATTAVGTDLAARMDAETLVLIGYGTQALQHARAISLVRNLRKIIITGRSADRAKVCANMVAREFDGQVVVVESIEDAVRQGDIICTLTHAREPIVKGGWLAEGSHVNAIGASVRGYREIDEEVVLRSRFFGDFEEGIRSQSEEYLTPLQDKIINKEHLLGDLGGALLGVFLPRTSRADITCFKSIGNVVQDIAASAFVLRAAGPITADVPPA